MAWFSGDFDEAIEWGELGEREKKKSGLDTVHDTSHTLALARRDSGDINTALGYFTTGLSIKEILAEDHNSSKRGPTFYGNIGRCLALRGDTKQALRLYARSYDLLQQATTAPLEQLNLGYAACWIADALYALADHEGARHFYWHASDVWQRRAPKRAEAPNLRLSEIEETTRDKEPEQVADWCRTWVSNELGA